MYGYPVSVKNKKSSLKCFGANGLVTNGGWLTRGYTGHEHVPQVDLINMNGRMYDAVLGRMLSPDNFVADPTNTQAYNRYSYVINNPLKYTDPSGWFLKAREEGREIAFPDVPHKGEEYGGCPGGFFNSSIFNYNFQGSYSSYVSNQGYYSFIYGTQTGMQAAVQAGYVQSKINLALSILSYSSKWQWTGRSGNEGSAGEQKQRNINRTWTFGDDGMAGAMASDNPMYIGIQPSGPRIGYHRVNQLDAVADYGGDLFLAYNATKLENHIANVSKYYSYSKYGKPIDGTAAFGSRFLTGNTIFKLNSGVKFLGMGFNILGASTSIAQAVIYQRTNGQHGQHPGYTVGDLSTAFTGFKTGGWAGFAIAAGWSFVVKPIIQSNFTIGIQPANTSYGQWRTFP